MQAAARLEAAVERLAVVLQARLSRPDMADPDHLEAGDAPQTGDTIPRAEVAALAERLEATVARLRAALPDELRGGEA